MKQYTGRSAVIQIPMDQGFEPPIGWLAVQSGLTGFQQTSGEWNVAEGYGIISQTLYGECKVSELDRVCEVCELCGGTIRVHETRTRRLRHIPNGSARTILSIEHSRLRFPCCGHEHKVPVQFQSSHHMMTLHLERFIEDLLELGLTLKDVHRITGVHRHTVKAIDKRRLRRLYTENGKLKKPERQAKVLGIDAFSFHKGQQYAVIIMDMETGHVLWVQHTKRKQVVYDFIEHVGKEWMTGVKAICCDMNANLSDAFQEKCPHLAVVFDRFHIIKNFNEKVVDNVRKDEERRLVKEGDAEGAKLLKNSKYILSANRDTLKKRDAQAGISCAKPASCSPLFPWSARADVKRITTN